MKSKSSPTRAKPLRADGQRNREKLLRAAEKLVRRDGSQASLEEIARSAGVGSATLHRHFPSRHALLEAIFRDGVAQLCARATPRPGGDPGAELIAWLEELTLYTATHRGLAAALLAGSEGLSPEELCCTDMLLGVLQTLLTRAAAAGGVRPGVSAKDLMLLTNAIAVANEGDPRSAKRVLRLALAGVRP